MFSEEQIRWFRRLIVPICLGLFIYPISFDGKQIVSLDAPLSLTFDVLVNHLWKLHPFIIDIKQIRQINETSSYYQITDRLSMFNVQFNSTYFVLLNIDRENHCLTSVVETPWNIMKAYHQYCLHSNTLKPSNTIITDQFHGQSWMIFMKYIRTKMYQSHRHTLERLRREMSIYSGE